MRYVLILSGKGGVGKTLVSVSSARKLTERGIKTALIDADLSNPNAAELLGIKDQLVVSAESFEPLIVDKIEFFSMEALSQGKPVVMPASEYAQILRDVIKYTKWTAEICIIDMPATVADTFLEVITTFGEDLLGSIIVLQPAHVIAARKILQLHKSESVPVLGVIENMSKFTCEHGTSYEVFGKVDLEGICKEFGVEPLGSIPLSMDIRKSVEEGKPFLPEVLSQPVVKGVEKIIQAKPVGVTFVERLKERLKGIARDTLLDVMAAVINISNEEIKISDIQKQYGFPGDRVIELDVTDESLNNVKIREFFRIDAGTLKKVRTPKKVDDEIRIWERALIWCILGKRSDTQAPFDLMDAWFLGKVKYYSGTAGTPRALQFMRSVWASVKDAPSFAKLKPVLEHIA